VIRAIVFDFDGVIANSEPLHFRAFRDVLAERSISLAEQEYYDRYLGFDDVGAFAAISRDRGIPFTPRDLADLTARKAVRMEALERDGSVLFPGARGAIERMAGIGATAIASGAIRAEILRVLEHEQLAGFFRAIVGAEDAPKSKPAPDPYRRAVELLSETVDRPLRAAECAAIEDSRWGIESARAAGLRVIGVTHTYTSDALAGTDVVIDHLDELTPALLATLG
jgi:beta-phosphoglucomutase-like phosphatase (HAD superfamily)